MPPVSHPLPIPVRRCVILFPGANEARNFSIDDSGALGRKTLLALHLGHFLPVYLPVGLLVPFLLFPSYLEDFDHLLAHRFKFLLR